MNQLYAFKTNFLNPEKSDSKAKDNHFGHSTRNICFQWLDGQRAFYNYAFLVSVKLETSNKNINSLSIYFTSDTVVLEGYHLNILFDLFLFHFPKIISQEDHRYFKQDKKDYYITSIEIKG
ncbi:hypothetical protein LZF95_19535 [Algoriphagus sp. AGSA1]|uniref:hypothetical protein n=1 Tax=Algoriphagus sp. AGSA1 TaxID=2907213 RepID=UPI001F221C75|nr:hypothetical protein [Algoriphagus sp. AGSA1]MCE7056881.1 hypothetical protein [Algoriphagus sp. AGSA1]